MAVFANKTNRDTIKAVNSFFMMMVIVVIDYLYGLLPGVPFIVCPVNVR